MRAIGASLPPGTPVEIWFQDGWTRHASNRVGQKGTLTRVRAETGSRLSAPRSDGYQSVYLFGAVCPGRDLGCALILPRCDTAAMTLFLEQLGGHVAPGAHAIVVLDRAGWHTARELRWPDNLTPLPRPAYSPELNPQERVWAFAPALSGAAPLPRPHGPARGRPGRLAPVPRRAGARPLPLLLSLGCRLLHSRKRY